MTIARIVGPDGSVLAVDLSPAILGFADRHAREAGVANVREALEAAGFEDVVIRIVDAPLEMDSARACAQLQREAFGGLDQLLASMSDDERGAVWEEVAHELDPFERDGSFRSRPR